MSLVQCQFSNVNVKIQAASKYLDLSRGDGRFLMRQVLIAMSERMCDG